MGKTSARFFVEPNPRGNVAEINRQVAEFLGLQSDDAQMRVWCKGLKHPKQMWEAGLDQCTSLLNSGVDVAVWKKDNNNSLAERVTWLKSSKKHKTVRKKKLSVRRPPPEF